MLKKTKTRECVLNTLKHSNIPLTANDIYNKLKDNSITLSSIYRTLDAFSKNNIIIKNASPDGTAIYSLLNKEHCHFLECKNCHKKIKLNYCPYDKINKTIGENNDFTIDEHNVIIYGTCKDCK